MTAEWMRAPATRRAGAMRPISIGGLMLFALLIASALPAAAATRAWLDRSQTTEGEAVTLNIETDQAGVAPDYTPLQRDFSLGTPFRSRQSTGAGQLFGIALTPRRSGLLEIPAVRVGRESSGPLRLQVAAAAASSAGDAQVFVESHVDDTDPYVQQSVGVTVRLHYAVPLLSGELTQEAPDGAALQRIGDDVQSTRQIGGRRFNVVERRYLLVPERSGPMRLPGARFRGQAAGGFFDDMFGERQDLSASTAPRDLDVIAQPAAAPQPWLPLRGLRLRYVSAPTTARAGEAVDLVVEAIAQGGTRALFPELPAPDPVGAQVFAEPAEYTERFVDGSPELTVTRRFALVPTAPGVLQVTGAALPWWDVASARRRDASLPPLQIEVAEAAGGSGASGPMPSLPAQQHSGAVPVDAVQVGADGGGAGRLWRWAALGFAALWLLTLAWALRLRGRAGEARDGAAAAGGAMQQVDGTRMTLADLRRVLDAGSLDDIVGCLRQMRAPVLVDMDAVLARLDDPAQRQALEAMRRALWAGAGQPAEARAALRTAFRNGPRWRGEAAPERDGGALPPLYP